VIEVQHELDRGQSTETCSQGNNMASISSDLESVDFPAVTFLNSESTDPSVFVPASATTLAGYREWALSDEFPERGKICFVAGGLIVDMSPESLEYHSDLKSEFSRVLLNLVREQNLGRLHIDGALVTNEKAGVSNEPDILFLSKKTLSSERIKLTSVVDKPDSSKEIVGSVDWVLEIVSPSSIRKDKVLLRKAYFEAGIDEYWIVDVLAGEIEFQLLVPGEKEYVAAESDAGWQRSPVFERWFRLDREKEDDGGWLYTLHMKN